MKMVSDVDSVLTINMTSMIKKIVIYSVDDREGFWEVTFSSNPTMLVFVQLYNHVQDCWGTVEPFQDQSESIFAYYTYSIG